jgi:REP element-mobilizing transposase RayT
MIWVRNFNPEIHHRRSIRLPGYDYSRPGYYFITLCCSFRECLFGEIRDNKMILNDFGRIAYDEWIQSVNIRSEIELDEFVVMPNHFHAIVIINCRGDRPVAPTGIVNPVAPTNLDIPVAPTNLDIPVAPTQNQLGDPPVAPTRPMGPKSKSIGSLMAGYKSSVTKKINQLRHKPGELVWQRNYFEHIIRDEKSLIKIRKYILDNPGIWSKDEFYR